MTTNISPLARASVQAIEPYASARRSMSGGAVWLNANENALAPSYQLNGCFNRYPSCQPASLVQAYASYAGVQPEQVLVSRGADEGIELLIRSFCEPVEDRIAICPPTYGMYAISAQSNQVATVTVPLLPDFTLDTDALMQCNAKLVFICSPNNPTGDLIPRQQIIEVLEHFHGEALVVVDEAYIEFAMQASVIDLLATYPHLVILRTLSKAFALAGLRCGFTLAAPEVIQALKQMIAPYPIAEPVAQIATQALSEQGIAAMQQSVATINQLRNDFSQFVAGQPGVTTVWPSNANYVLLQVDDAAACVSALQAEGILIRNQSAQRGLSEVVRVSIGSPEEMQALQQAMQRYFSSCTSADSTPDQSMQVQEENT
ncbi:histidinol-phosphate transaminase [Alkalimonas collagenimarina]|uniref:Histidinol-phosphate aminotransferase n=1 Tax=Alkalimonas collagenimarina TaxID=400390 RepID=A0ABT9GUA9_9GAMM|nr:histidinol-phosphate transaminase [Alkalimonas collagenimarina]MDP4534636.1 histidinol-phosphate transaminase [Alkalimonas collagenimarina]